VTGRRSYQDPCGIARALDLVGERWALLVVRELLLGPKRFSDLHRSLPVLSQNVLSTRLRELEEAGVVARRRLDPPAASRVYELTPWGRDLEPVLFHLARWGSRAPLPEGGELSADALMMALRTTFDPAAAGALRLAVELRLREDLFVVAVTGGTLRVARPGPADLDLTTDLDLTADVVLTTDPGTLRSLVFAGADPAPAIRDGKLRVRGDLASAIRFLRLFPRPAPPSEHGQCAEKPPSTKTACPVRYEPAGLARNTATPSKSAGTPLRPVKVRAASAATRSGSAEACAVSGVCTNPGTTALQHTPRPDQASACDRDSATTPALDTP